MIEDAVAGIFPAYWGLKLCANSVTIKFSVYTYPSDRTLDDPVAHGGESQGEADRERVERELET